MLKTTLRSIAGHKARLAMTGLAVVLGVALMSGTLVLTDTVGRTFDNLFADVFAGTDAEVRSTDVIEAPFGPDSRSPIATSVLDIVNATPGVSLAEGAVGGFAQLVDPRGEPVGNPAGGAPTLGFNWPDSDQLNPFRLVEGSAPQGPDDVVVDRGSATTADISVGDTVTVLTTSAPATMEVTGIATFGELDSPAGASVVLFTLPTAQQLMGSPDTLSSISVVADEGLTQDELVERLNAALPAGIEAVSGADRTAEDQSAIAESLSFFNTFLLAFAAVALIVGAFIIYNTFTIVLAQRTRELALLRAVGASRRQVMGSMLGEAAIVGVVASAIGLVLGVATAVGLRLLLRASGIDIPSTSIIITPATALVAMGTGTAITVAAAVLPALRASRIAPVAALRDVAVEPTTTPTRRVVAGGVVLVGGLALLGFGLTGSGGSPLQLVAAGALGVFIGVAVLAPAFARPVARTLAWPLARLRGVTGSIARENAARNPTRTATTASALMIGVALVAFIAIFAASARASIDRVIDDSFTGDLIIDSGQFVGGGFSPELAAKVASAPGVAGATGVRFTQAAINGDATFAVAVDSDVIADVVDPRVTGGQVTGLGSDGIAVSDTWADSNAVAVGDTLAVRLPSGERQMTVQGTYDNRQLLGDQFIDTAAVEAPGVEQLDTQVWVRVTDGADPAAVRDELVGIASEWPNAEVLDLTEFKQAQAAQIDPLLSLVFALLGLAIIIALVGIANTLALSVFERTRELGLMRAVGMTRAQLRSVIRWESVIIAVFGTLLGLAIGIVFGWIMVQALSSEGLSELSIPTGTLIVVVVLAAFAGVVAALLPARRAARLNVLDAISST